MRIGYSLVAALVLQVLQLLLLLDFAVGVSVMITNKAEKPVEVYWVDPEYGQLVSMGPPVNDEASMQLNSFEGHKFVVRYSDQRAGVFNEAHFTKSAMDEKFTIVVDKSTGLLKARGQKEKVSNVVQSIADATSDCQNLLGDAFSDCVASNILDDVEKITESKSHMDKYRTLMSSRLRNYTCTDESMVTSPSINTYHMQLADVLNPSHVSTYTINELLNKDNAKIWYVDDFVTAEECDVLIKSGRPRLARATVAAEDGTSIVSEARKANQASYNMNRRSPEQDPLWSLFNRALDLTNKHTGLQLSPPGQEDFTIIQYNPDDQYSPHCDGTCDGSTYNLRGRVATAVMYCKTADRGGATTFTKSDLFVKPKPGSATFFSYKGSDGRMDEGLTEHSGCPVVTGEKFITTIWMREGVTAADPWSAYDPSGYKILN